MSYFCLGNPKKILFMNKNIVSKPTKYFLNVEIIKAVMYLYDYMFLHTYIRVNTLNI